MTITYYKSESDTRPELTEYGKKTVYIRKNITEVQRTDEITGEIRTSYEYDEAALTYDEYDQYELKQQIADIEEVIVEIIGGAV